MKPFLRGGKPAICALYQKGWRSFGKAVDEHKK